MLVTALAAPAARAGEGIAPIGLAGAPAAASGAPADASYGLLQLVAEGVQNAAAAPRREVRSEMFVRTVAAGGDGGHVAQLDVRVARGPLPRVMVRHGDPAPEVTIAFAQVKQGRAIGRPLLLVRLDRAGGGIARGNLLATLTDEGGRTHRVGAALTADAGAGPQTIEMPLVLPGGVAPGNSQLTLAYLPQGERSPAFTATVALR